MAESIGAIIEGPQENSGIQKWKEFLLKPENLATTLVLAAGLTSERRPNQSRLNQGLQASVGALGFRGALEADIRDQRLAEQQRREESQAQSAEQDIARRRVAAQETQAQAATQPRPLNPSEIEENQARAGLLNAQADALGREGPATDPVAMMLQQELERAANFGEQPDIAGAVQRGTQLQMLLRAQKEGRIRPDGTIDLTDEELALFPELQIETPETETQTPTSSATQPESRRGSGRMFPANLLAKNVNDTPEAKAIREMRKIPGFEELDDSAILDRVEQARELANDRNALRNQTDEQLRGLLEAFGRVLSPSEARNIWKARARRANPHGGITRVRGF